MAVINGVILKGRHLVIPVSLKKQALKQLYVNHTGIEKLNALQTNQFIGQISMKILEST